MSILSNFTKDVKTKGVKKTYLVYTPGDGTYEQLAELRTKGVDVNKFAAFCLNYVLENIDKIQLETPEPDSEEPVSK